MLLNHQCVSICHRVQLLYCTRLSVRSNNALSELPEAVFKLWSLRSLSAAQNKIEHLRLPSGGDPRQTLPVLEELYLQVRIADGRAHTALRVCSVVLSVVSCYTPCGNHMR